MPANTRGGEGAVMLRAVLFRDGERTEFQGRVEMDNCADPRPASARIRTAANGDRLLLLAVKLTSGLGSAPLKAPAPNSASLNAELPKTLSAAN